MDGNHVITGKVDFGTSPASPMGRVYWSDELGSWVHETTAVVALNSADGNHVIRLTPLPEAE